MTIRDFYNDKITQLVSEQADLIKLSKEQMPVVKSTLRSVNYTFNVAATNEAVLAKGFGTD
jgi:hypothetical protein